MFAFAQVIGSPIFNSIGSGTIEFPTLAAVIGWLLIAALVGSFLGLLREYGSDLRKPVERSSATLHTFPHPSDEAHSHAA